MDSWSLIASHLPGRTDNEIKNYWNSHLSRQAYTYRRIYTAGNDTTVAIDMSKLHSAEKRRGGRSSPKSSTSGDKASSDQEDPEPEPETGAKVEDDASIPAAATSSPPQSDDGARSSVVDPDQNKPSNSTDDNALGGPCSEDATGPMALESLDLGLWEAESEMDIEALLSTTGIGAGETSSFTTGLDAVGQNQDQDQVDDLLDMDWDGFAAHLWGDQTAQHDQAQAAEPQAAGCNPEELESFATWLLSDF